MHVLAVFIAFFAFVLTSILSVKAMGNVYSFKQKIFVICMIGVFMAVSCVDFEYVMA